MSPTGYREVREWLDKNRDLMINCPNQPGKLLISKNACSKRHKASLNPDLKIYAEDFPVCLPTGAFLVPGLPHGHTATELLSAVLRLILAAFSGDGDVAR